MSAHEIYLLFLGFFGALAIISVVAAILSEGSALVTGILVALSAGFYALAKRGAETDISMDAVTAAVSKAVHLIVG